MITAFELCRRHRELELAPVLRIVKYLGLDSTRLGEEDVARIVELHPHFLRDPELVIGLDQVAERTRIEPETVERLLQERRRDIPFLGTPRRPMIPRIGIQALQAIAAGASRTGVTPTGNGAGIPGRHDGNGNGDGVGASPGVDDLERQIQAALEQLRSLGQTLSRLSRQVRQARAAEGTRSSNGEGRRFRRSGGGRPDTIVEACRKILEDEGRPMKVADITARIVAQGVDIKAKNPNVTVSSILSSYEAFERVRRGFYTLAQTDPAS